MIYIAPDKYGHFGCGAIIGLSALWLGWSALLVVVILATAKEIYDVCHPPHSPEWLDIAATLLGGGLSIGLIYLHRAFP